MGQKVSDVTGGLYSIKWEENPDGPDERMLQEDHPFCDIIVACAEQDETANVTRIA